MDLPTLCVPLFVPEPDTQAAAAATAAASSVSVGLEASHHNPANAPDAVLRQQKLAGLAEWLPSIVAHVGAATAATILVDVDTDFPAIIDDLVTCGALDKRLIEMAATYCAPNRSLSLLQASLDGMATRLASPSTLSPHHQAEESTGVSGVVPHGFSMTPVWNNALQCGGGWIAWKQRFLSELELLGTFTEAQKLAELHNNVVPELCSFLNWDMECHHPLSTLQEGLDVFANLYASSYALNPKQIFASK
ncbi:MAG: hypothetical protein BJ554DRAFT_2378, partial [Olpidium bornovanus]